MVAINSILSSLKGASDAQRKKTAAAATGAAQAVAQNIPAAMQPASVQQALAPQQPGTNVWSKVNSALNMIGPAAQAQTKNEEKAAQDTLNAPAYQDVSQTYGKAQSDAANKNATEATKGQSYAPITSRFAGAGAYTQANASRTGQVLQNLYSGNAPVNATAGEAKLSAGLAAQGGAAFSQDKEKALKENAQKAYEATNPEVVAKKLLGNLNSVPQGVDLNYQAQSMIAPDVYAAERMDRQARVNESLRTGQTDALAAENELSNRNQSYKDGIKSYITDTSKSAINAAKGTLAADKTAAEGAVNTAKAEVAKAGTDAATIGNVNQLEKSLGKKLTAAGGSVSPEYIGQLRNEAAVAAKKITEDTAREASRTNLVKKQSDGTYKAMGGSSYAQMMAEKFNKQVRKAQDMSRIATNSKEYSGYAQGAIAAQNTAQSELDKIASQYGRFG